MTSQPWPKRPGAEIRPLVQALNGLLGASTCCCTTNVASPPMQRTNCAPPIAAIRMQAQVAMGADAQSPDRMQALSQVMAGCDRATHLVENSCSRWRGWNRLRRRPGMRPWMPWPIPAACWPRWHRPHWRAGRL